MNKMTSAGQPVETGQAHGHNALAADLRIFGGKLFFSGGFRSCGMRMFKNTFHFPRISQTPRMAQKISGVKTSSVAVAVGFRLSPDDAPPRRSG